MKVFHLSAQDSVRCVVIYSAYSLFIVNVKVQLWLGIKTVI
jgi:hypothetical protein